MKTLLKLFALTFCLLFGGCYKTVTEGQFLLKVNNVEKETVLNECREINAEGDIMKLLAEIKEDTNEVIGILEGDDLEGSRSRIESLADGIDAKTKKVISLSRVSWVNSKWNYEVKWILDREDFKDLWGTHVKYGFELKEAKLQDVYLMGEKRSDLLSHISLNKKGNAVEITLKNHGSSLEICQLNKTLMILAKANFRNIKNNNIRYFNLILQ